MNKVQMSQAFLRKRKVMMVLPLLVIPFLTMAFWAIGGGSGDQKKNSSTRKQGLNLQLPSANLKEEGMLDKMSFYDRAAQDSIKLAEQMRNDPYFRHQDSSQQIDANELEQITQQSAGKYNQLNVVQSGGLKISPYERASIPAEEKVMKKLAEINAAINENESSTLNNEKSQNSGDREIPGFGQEVDRLESMMRMMNNQENNDDPEMQQLGNTLNKILDIQHPERVQERIKQKSLDNKEVVYPVSKTFKKENISLLDTGRYTTVVTGFFGLEIESSLPDVENAIEAVVHENQILVNGSVVKLRLLNDIYINGALILKGNFLFGMASLNAERLEIEINSIKHGQSLYPVKLEVFDIDGLSGIYVPGTITRDVAKQSADNSLQMMELTTLDPSLKAQATAAGIGAAKTLFSRKVKQVKVLVKAGYKVLLKDKNVKQ